MGANRYVAFSFITNRWFKIGLLVGFWTRVAGIYVTSGDCLMVLDDGARAPLQPHLQ